MGRWRSRTLYCSRRLRFYRRQRAGAEFPQRTNTPPGSEGSPTAHQRLAVGRHRSKPRRPRPCQLHPHIGQTRGQSASSSSIISPLLFSTVIHICLLLLGGARLYCPSSLFVSTFGSVLLTDIRECLIRRDNSSWVFFSLCWVVYLSKHAIHTCLRVLKSYYK